MIRGIYVERLIRGSMDDLWRLTQTAELHERWDLRFTRIEYLPRTDPAAPQRFLYATRIGFGLEVAGEGESRGHRDGPSGARTSALRFWSADAKSLIRNGSGYWRYIPSADGVRFITSYTYDTRFGGVGRAVDALVFRPLLGWATAWSFDRLRLWIERGVDPAVSLERSAVHAVARVTLAFIFFYHGLVPKLVAPHPDEVTMLVRLGVASCSAPAMLTLIGAGELAAAAALLLAWHARWMFGAVIAFMGVALALVGATSPEFLRGAFNAVTLDAAAAALAVIGLLSSAELPSAARCLRRPPPGD